MTRAYMTAVELANQAKARSISLPTDTELFAKAWQRVSRSRRLRKYERIILADWSEGDDHLRWVIRGRVGEIESWAKQIQEDSDE